MSATSVKSSASNTTTGADAETRRQFPWWPLAGWAVAHWLALQLVRGAGVLFSHLPPSLLPTDPLVIGLLWIERMLLMPRRLMLAAWPGESTPGWLLVVSMIVNSLLFAALVLFIRRRRLQTPLEGSKR